MRKTPQHRALFGLTMFLVATMLTTIARGDILFIDDDRGLTGESTWFSTLSGLGYTYDYEAISANANPTSNLLDYDVVIWTIGDHAYTNLTAANVTTMTNFLDNGGSLLYSGGHNVYDELTNAGSFIPNYLGLSNFNFNMPTISGATTMNGTAHSVTGLNLYATAPWAAGNYGGTMMSGFNVTTADPMLTNPVGSSGGPFGAAIHDSGTYKAMTWGFDLNQMTNSGQQAQLLGDSLQLLGATSVPEPSTAGLAGLAVFGFCFVRRRK